MDIKNPHSCYVNKVVALQIYGFFQKRKINSLLCIANIRINTYIFPCIMRIYKFLCFKT